MWTRKEIKFVDENIGKLTYKKMGEVLGRSPKSVFYCVKQLLNKSAPQKASYYKDYEDDFIRKNYKSLTDLEMSEKIGRTKCSVQQRRMVLGLLKTNKKTQKITAPIKNKKKVLKREDGEIWQRNIKNKDGDIEYKYLLIKNDGKIIYYHRYIWELTNATLKGDEVIRFKNKDTLDCRIENLYISNRKKVIKENQNQNQGWVARKCSKNDLYMRILNGHAGYE